MSDTLTINLDDPALCEADARAVMEKIVTGKPVSPEIVSRVRARGEKITERLRATYGEREGISAELIREVRDEE